MYAQELLDLGSSINSRFYLKYMDRVVTVHFVLVTLGEQPERRNIDYDMNGNSLYGSR